ncbi:phytanoyl-CoA dioxygenase PhyH [Rhizobium sp. SJZ105]|uniref:phytanoyl-CoA dioxygenase family protein n=1 Tax=Rhizobium sp. SJZ105 TaxID=2572678 RepID=UPI0011AC003A|nr:phytanoyl-CoA dioxygenase family protein [Rhizobium sp. SJZ105]TWC76335.1 phytanoyl-CoA dioxygenase PhyH [Rhizobium sp. SJZ105]
MDLRSEQFILPENAANEYEVNGVYHAKSLVSSTWLERLREVIDREMAEAKSKHFAFKSADRGRFVGSQDIWRTDEVCSEFCLKSELPRVCSELTHSTRINLFFDHLFVKEPGSGHVTSWHNDFPYWPIKGDQIVSSWVALDDVTEENGALTFALGSHRWNAALQPATFAEKEGSKYSDSDLEKLVGSLGFSETPQFRMFEMQAGDCLFFHSHAVHNAGANRSLDKLRRGYAVRYTGDDVVYDPRAGVHKMMLEPTLVAGGPITSTRFPQVWPQHEERS